jgi:hypothetical protein
MDVLTRFFDKKNYEDQIKVFYTLYGRSGMVEVSREQERVLNLGRSSMGDEVVGTPPDYGGDYYGSLTNFDQSMMPTSLTSREQYGDLKKLAINRLKGRALVASAKNGNDVSLGKAFLRWRVRCVKKIGRGCLEKLCARVKLSANVGLVRFKE